MLCLRPSAFVRLGTFVFAAFAIVFVRFALAFEGGQLAESDCQDNCQCRFLGVAVDVEAHHYQIASGEHHCIVYLSPINMRSISLLLPFYIFENMTKLNVLAKRIGMTGKTIGCSPQTACSRIGRST